MSRMTDRSVEAALTAAIALATVAALALLAAEESDAAASLPWREDFDDGDLVGWSVTEVGGGTVEVTTAQYVSPSYSLHVKAPQEADQAMARPDVVINSARNYLVELDFMYTGGNHWIEIFKDYDMCIALDSGSSLLVRSSYHGGNTYVMSLSPGTWYHFKALYNSTAQVTKLWVDGVDMVTVNRDEDFNGIRVGDVFPDSNYGEGFWDNFIIYYEDEGISRPPRWLDLPELRAVEDTPLVHNFTLNLTDPDTALRNLSIATQSPFVSSIRGLEVTFVFPNGVLVASVTLVLSDRFTQVVGDVNFTVTPVNDPPTCSIGRVWRDAVEDVPFTINFTSYVADIDNVTSDLFLTIALPYDIYATVQGLNLTMTFPEGVLMYDEELRVSDGINTTMVALLFYISAVDDAPIVAPLPTFTATEDRDSAFNLTPYLSDIDTPVPSLTVLVRDPNCTVDGQMLHFLYTRGDVDFNISLEVTDASSRVTALLRVHVAEVNDPPIVHGVSPKLFTEDQPKAVDLSAYIEDEDTPRDRLVLESTDPHVVRPIVGFNLTLLYPTWMPEHTVNFSVFDGSARANGSFDVQVQAVNDPPAVLGLGDLTPPVTIVLDEGTELHLQVRVSDEDSATFKYTMTSQWSGVTAFQNGTVRVVASHGDIGNFTATLGVDDMNGGSASLLIAIEVLNVNDPPTRLVLVLPQNHIIVEEGTNVTFSVDVLDPDAALGQVLTVTWVSNVSGLIRTLLSDRTLMFVTDQLPVGAHRITVAATDGQYVREAWLELTVTAKYVPPQPKPEEPSFFTSPSGIAAVLIVIILVIVGVVLLVVMGRRRDAEEEAERASAGPAAAPPPEPVMAPIAMEGGLSTLGRSLGDMATELEATRAAEASAAAAVPAGPAPALETVPVPLSEADEADREHTREVREVMKALTQLPQGLPTALWGWDMAELARAIVDGERRTTPDGTPLVKIKGKWYNADRANAGVFAREWKEPEAPVAPKRATTTAEERDRKLEQLETALLEGKISEQTYRELKRKYEGGR